MPWKRSLISSYPQVSSIMDKVLVYEPTERCAASTVLQDPWMVVSDPAISASAELLARGTLLYNLSTLAELFIHRHQLRLILPCMVLFYVFYVISLDLGTFGDLSDLEKKIVSLVADHAPDAKLALLRRTFRAFDTSNQGVLHVSELIDGFRSS